MHFPASPKAEGREPGPEVPAPPAEERETAGPGEGPVSTALRMEHHLVTADSACFPGGAQAVLSSYWFQR